MTGRKWALVILFLIASVSVTGVWRRPRFNFFVPAPRVTQTGAVLVRNDDVDKQTAIPSVDVSVAGDLTSRTALSTSNGFFQLVLDKNVKPAQPVVLQFRHPQYQPLDLTVLAGAKLETATMVPTIESSPSAPAPPSLMVSEIRIRYLTRTTSLVNVGSIVKTFRVDNTANVPCNDREPCSPDGKWKAAIGSTTIEATEGNIFSSGRVSCIAGPCPFTKIRFDGFSRGGPSLRVAVLNWSSTTVFLVEAEVFHPMSANTVNFSYPVIFGRTLHFTVPADTEGLCIEAEVNGKPIVFPFGPEPILSWASCTVTIGQDRSALYQCELTPTYGFKQ